MNCPDRLHLLRGIFRQVLVGDGLDAERAEMTFVPKKPRTAMTNFRIYLFKPIIAGIPGKINWPISRGYRSPNPVHMAISGAASPEMLIDQGPEGHPACGAGKNAPFLTTRQ